MRQLSIFYFTGCTFVKMFNFSIYIIILSTSIVPIFTSHEKSELGLERVLARQPSNNILIGRTKREGPNYNLDITEIPNSPDPFMESSIWAKFLIEIEDVIKEVEKFGESLGNSIPKYGKRTKVKVLQEFAQGFGSKVFSPIKKYFDEFDSKLDFLAAYTQINPGVGLNTIRKCIEESKIPVPRLLSQIRLKWIETNAFATTLNYVFDRILLKLGQGGGLPALDGIWEIGYPSWRTQLASNSSQGDTVQYDDLRPEHLANLIHDSMISLGSKNHLIRGLEYILSYQIVFWNPRVSDLNMYCYGNNEFARIHIPMEVSTASAWYLSLTDMKYAIFQIIQQVYLRWSTESKRGDGITPTGSGADTSSKIKSILKEMRTRIDHKIKFVNPVPSGVNPPDGPLIYKCDQPPLPVDNSTGSIEPIFTSPLLPPGFYLQNNTLYNDKRVLVEEKDLDGHPLVNGSTVPGLIVEKEYWGPNGMQIHDPTFDPTGKFIIDEKGEPIPGVILKRVLYLTDKLPSRHPVPVKYSPTQWGVLEPFQQRTPKVNLSSIRVPLDPQSGPMSKNGTTGFLDPRTPNSNEAHAEFFNTFPTYIESEQVLNPEHICTGTCSDFERPTNTCVKTGNETKQGDAGTTECQLYRKAVCEDGKDCLGQASCPSTARKCKKLGQEVKFCPAKANSGKMYEWMEVNGRPYGKSKSNFTEDPGTEVSIPPQPCSSEVMVARERWEVQPGTILSTPQYCELCLCVCDEALGEDGYHYVDTSRVFLGSDVPRAMTMIRFEQHGNVLGLGIQMASLLPGGKVDPESLTWVTGKGVKVRDGKSRLGYEFKKINLDMIQAGPNEVIGGIALKVYGNSIGLEVQLLEVELETGLLIDKGWRGPTTTNFPRARIQLGDVRSPRDQVGPSQPFDLPDNSKYIELQAADADFDQGFSVTVPFFDTQKVHDPVGLSPFSSVGIMYKSKKGSGGFFTPVISLKRDFSKTPQSQ